MGEAPELFVPVAGGWGRMGATHIRLAKANRDVLTGALHAAWKLRVDKSAVGAISPKEEAAPLMYGPSSALYDIRHAIRRLRHSVGFSAVAIVTIALTIGASSRPCSAS